MCKIRFTAGGCWAHVGQRATLGYREPKAEEVGGKAILQTALEPHPSIPPQYTHSCSQEGSKGVTVRSMGKEEARRDVQVPCFRALVSLLYSEDFPATRVLVGVLRQYRPQVWAQNC